MSYTFVVLRHDRNPDELAIMYAYLEREVAEEAAKTLRKSRGAQPRAIEVRCLRIGEAS